MLKSKKCVGIKLHPVLHEYMLAEQGEKIFSFAKKYSAIVQIHPEKPVDRIRRQRPHAEYSLESVGTSPQMGAGPQIFKAMAFLLQRIIGGRSSLYGDLDRLLDLSSRESKYVSVGRSARAVHITLVAEAVCRAPEKLLTGLVHELLHLPLFDVVVQLVEVLGKLCDIEVAGAVIDAEVAVHGILQIAVGSITWTPQKVVWCGSQLAGRHECTSLGYKFLVEIQFR